MCANESVQVTGSCQTAETNLASVDRDVSVGEMEMMTCRATALTVLLTPTVERVCLAGTVSTSVSLTHSEANHMPAQQFSLTDWSL